MANSTIQNPGSNSLRGYGVGGKVPGRLLTPLHVSMGRDAGDKPAHFGATPLSLKNLDGL
ncbi:hypothetical protein CTA1_11343 [Colletotrichum tanaceti]|uniref:Uncharacterized protein n=1 Tax=Colletotrichum tanaceti TaxID=1306861 RepID=A0A4U6X930_9PEZI|nr:hypothetical protein CTA1_11343 [Colletotrichum tanaceti]